MNEKLFNTFYMILEMNVLKFFTQSSSKRSLKIPLQSMNCRLLNSAAIKRRADRLCKARVSFFKVHVSVSQYHKTTKTEIRKANTAIHLCLLLLFVSLQLTDWRLQFFLAELCLPSANCSPLAARDTGVGDISCTQCIVACSTWDV